MALGAIALVALAVRMDGLGNRPLWSDELISLFAMRQTLGEVLASSLQDVHPPLSFIVLQGWGRLLERAGALPAPYPELIAAGAITQGNRFWLRLPGVVFSSLAALLAAATSGRVPRGAFSPSAALWCGFWCALSPDLVMSSRDVRHYGALHGLTAGVLYCLARGHYSCLMLLLAAGLLTHYYFAIVWLGVAVVWIVQGWRPHGEETRPLLSSLVLATLVAAPWYLARAAATFDRAPLTPLQPDSMRFSWPGVWSLLSPFAAGGNASPLYAPEPLSIGILLFAVSSGLVLYALFLSTTSKEESSPVISASVAMIAGGLALMVGISIWKPVLSPRYSAFLVIPLAVASGIGLGGLRARWTKAACVLGGALILLAGLLNTLGSPVPPPDLPEEGAFVNHPRSRIKQTPGRMLKE